MMDSYLKTMRAKVGHAEIKVVGAVVLVLNEQGQVLLQRRSDFGIWGLPGGSMEASETPPDCALRETLEETGLELLELDMIGFSSKDPAEHLCYPNGDRVHAHSFIFASTAWQGELSTANEETLELAFFNLSELPELLPNMRLAIEMFTDYLPQRQFQFR